MVLTVVGMPRPVRSHPESPVRRIQKRSIAGAVDTGPQTTAAGRNRQRVHGPAARCCRTQAENQPLLDDGGQRSAFPGGLRTSLGEQLVTDLNCCLHLNYRTTHSTEDYAVSLPGRVPPDGVSAARRHDPADGPRVPLETWRQGARRAPRAGLRRGWLHRRWKAAGLYRRFMATPLSSYSTSGPAARARRGPSARDRRPPRVRGPRRRRPRARRGREVLPGTAAHR